MTIDKIQELLKERFEVIAEDTSGNWKVGDVFTFDREVAQTYDHWKNQNGELVIDIRYKKYPHLFRPLAWWEKRSVDEMPEYIKWANGIRKVSKWINDESSYGMYAHSEDGGDLKIILKYSNVLPATQYDYEQFKKL